MANVRIDNNGVPKGAVFELTAPTAHRSSVTAVDASEPASVGLGVNADGYAHVDFDVDVTLGGTDPMVEVAPLFYDATSTHWFRGQSAFFTASGRYRLRAEARGAVVFLQVVALTYHTHALAERVGQPLVAGRASGTGVRMDLATMRARLRADLRDEDAANQRWSNATLDRHLARAVQELSLAAPREVTATLTTSAGSREVSIASLTSRVTIEAVEYPAGQYPPAYAPYSAWGDTLTLLVDGLPGAGESVIVRYGALHTLDATSTTIPDRLLDLAATGAVAYAAIEWASYATNRINLGGDDTWRHYHTWGQERLAAFSKGLAKHGRERGLRARRLYLPAAAALGPRPLEG